MFDMTELFQRVYGTEVEYGTEEMLNNSPTYQVLEGSKLLNYLPQGLVRAGSQGMMSNGARYYGDIGGHLEYATAEHTSLWETVAAEIAGERIASIGLEGYAQEQDIKKAQLFKSVYKDNKTTWGYHFNISADGNKIPGQLTTGFKDTVYLLGLHLATYNLYAGGGTLYEDGAGKFKFSLAQKALGLTCDFMHSTTGDNKPLINLRDEPHAPNMNIRRMHITSGDPNISPWASWMMLGTTSLVLRAIEQGMGEQKDILHLKPNLPGRTFEPLSRLTATDLTFSRKAEFDNGQKLTPLEIQKYIYGIVENTYHTDQEAEVLGEWKKALEDHEGDPMLLQDRSGAIAKMAIMKAYAQRKGIAFSDENYSDTASKFIDHNFTTIAFIDKSEDAKPIELLSSKVRKSSFKKWMDEERVVDNIYNPPTTTRAYLRGNAIKKGNVVGAEWSKYRLADGREVKLGGPLIFENDERLAG